MKREERTITVSGMDNMGIKPGDLMSMGTGEWVQVISVKSSTKMVVGPLTLWQRITIWFEETLLEAKILWWVNSGRVRRWFISK